MKRHAWLLAILLAIPVIGFGTGAGVRARLNSRLRTEALREFPKADRAAVAKLTVSGVCRQSGAGLSGLCDSYSALGGLELASIYTGLGGLLLVGLISLAALGAMRSRLLLLLLFRPGLYLTAIAVVVLMVAHGGIAMAAIYYGESAAFGEVHLGIVAVIGFGVVLGVVALGRALLRVPKKATATAIGKAVSREDSPQLWSVVDGLADRLGALRPDYIVVGIEPQFYVTEADVVTLDRRLSGRTLFCSLPLSRVLSRDEFTGVIAHELGHFSGQDTRFSEHFYPIYAGTISSMDSLFSMLDGVHAVALLPAIWCLGVFLERFGVAEHRHGRYRELAADAVAAAAVGPRCIATALVKIHGVAPFWGQIQIAAIRALEAGSIYLNVSGTYAALVNADITKEYFDGLADSCTSHPTDTHPPLGTRLRSLGVRLDDVVDEAMLLSPDGAAAGLIPNIEDWEREISEHYQLILARRAGIDLEAAASAS